MLRRGFRWVVVAVALLCAAAVAPSLAHAGASDPLNVVVERLREGDVATALSLVEGYDAELRAVPRIAYLHGRLLHEAGRVPEAIAVFTSLEALSPSPLPSAITQDVHDRRARWQASLAPRRPPRSTPAAASGNRAIDKVERAERLLAARREQAAADLLRGAPPRSLRARWYHVRGLALFRMRNHYDEAAHVFALAAASKSDTQDFDAFHAARALARADHNDRAIKEFRKFGKRFSSSEYAAEASYLAAWLELRMGRAVGFANMEKFARSSLGNSAQSLKREALWTLGYRAYTQQRHEQAQGFLLEVATGSGEQMERNGANYWAGRAKHDAGDKPGAAALWNAVIADDPFHWYALLSRARLLEAGTPAPALAPVTDTAAAANTATGATDVALPEDVAFYAGVGLFEDASKALRRQEKATRDRANDGQELRTLVCAYHAVDDHARPYHLTIAAHANSLMTTWTPETDWIWRTTMATPHRARVNAEASTHGLDPSYVYAIMRKESAFDPRVVSYADALGLMQLLHGTAVKVARVLGDPAPSRDDLFRPAVNIRLGTALLAQLEAELGPERALSMAGYNAGEHRVHQWLKRVSAKELDRFVEEIPIDQTRNYVRRVHANWARYRYLLEPTREPVTLTLELRTAE